MTENAQGLVSHCTFFSSMIQGDPLYSPSSCCFGSAWPAWGCPVGTTMREPAPPLSHGHLQPHGRSMSVFSTLISHALFSRLLPFGSLVLMQKSLEVEDGFRYKIQGGKKKMGTYHVLSGCQNILNVLPFIIQYIVPKQLVEKILFSITF